MEKKTTILQKITKFINIQVAKLSWVYIILFSILTLVLIQLYRSSINHTPTNPGNDRIHLDEKVENLHQQVSRQQMEIQSLQKALESLQNK